MADSPSAPPTTLPPFCGHEIWLPNCDTCLAGRGAEPLPAARPREEEATALLREADEHIQWSLRQPEKLTLVERLASALRESRDREAAKCVSCNSAAVLTERRRVEAAERERDALRIDASNANYMRLEALERTGERYRKLDAAFGSHGPSFDTLIDKAVESVAQLETATSRIAQLEQSLALSEDKVKALRQEIEALYKDVKHESAHEEGWNDAIDAVTALLSSPTPTTDNG